MVSDNHHFDFVTNLREFNKEIQNLGDGVYFVGASVRLQQLINSINKDGYGGIEYLFSVPGLVGGAVLMNAGGAISEGNSISDYIVSVDALYKGESVSLNKVDCQFAHRTSLFKNSTDYIITSAVFKFRKQECEESKLRIAQRLSYTSQIHDISWPNFGSVFCRYDSFIMKLFKRVQFGRKVGVRFSEKTENWLVNYGGGTFDMAIKEIEAVKRVHRLLHRDCATEVIIWN